MESSRSEIFENAKIDRHLKIPSLNQFDGFTDPSGSINLFDIRINFFEHTEIARCRFFYTCLKGIVLKWFNNLPPRPIGSWGSKKYVHFFYCLGFMDF